MLLKKKNRWVIEIVVIIFILVAARLWMQRDVVKGIAPDISQIMLGGQQFDLAQAKKPLLIHFWATWCPVCKLEQSNINNIAKDYPVITIAMQSGSDLEVRQFMQDEKLSFNVINDEEGILSRSYKIKGVPVSFIVNANSKIEFIEVGYTTEPGLRLRLWWAGL
jgi:thiol-disulfide isomerase/thioredoxin